MSFLGLSIFLVLSIAVLFLFYGHSFAFWKRHKFPHLSGRIPMGNLNFLTGKHFTTELIKLYEQFKAKGFKHGGFFLMHSPCYAPIDSIYIKHVLATDFNYFNFRQLYHNKKSDPLSVNLISCKFEEWKSLRRKVTPVFTLLKIKQMIPTMVQCTTSLQDYLRECCVKGDAFDLHKVTSWFTTDIIGSCAFGIDCNSFKDPNSEFASIGHLFFHCDIFKIAKIVFSQLWPSLAEKLSVRIVDKKASDFYLRIVRETIECREKLNTSRNDFLQALLDEKNNENNQRNKLTIEEIAAQSFVFFVAGFETSASALTFCLAELAYNQTIQNKLIDEIHQVLSSDSDGLTYNKIMEMKYLGQVVDEVLRKYPPIPASLRCCSEDYNVPYTDLVLPKGLPVCIFTYAVHHDPEYYPEPEKFDPERFSEEHKTTRDQFVYLPFGEGPKACIGMRFGLLQIKIGVVTILSQYRVEFAEDIKYPIDFNPFRVMLEPKERIFMKLTKLG